MKRNLIHSLLFIALVSSFTKGFTQNKPSLSDNKIKKQIIEQLCEKLKANYVYLDTALRMGNYIKHRFALGVYDTIKNPAVLADQLTKDLSSVYHDGHLSIDYDPGFTNNQDLKDTSVEKKQRERFLKFRKRVNFGFDKAEILPGNIGYIKIGGFFEPDNESKAMALAAFRFIGNSESLIIDLRNNMGGDPGMVSYICSLFFKNRTHLNDLYIRKDKSFTSYWTSPDSSLSVLNTIPIYILTSKKTFSAGEEFTYDLQTQKRAIIIGEITGGGAHPVAPYSISNGFIANIPYARAINPITKSDWETIGVKPDLQVEQSKALETAIEYIKTTKH